MVDDLLFAAEYAQVNSVKEYSVQEIPYKLAMDIVVANHYLHRKAPASFCYGMFDANENIIGVIVYGKPASPSLCEGICGKAYSKNVIELTRLWIMDGTPKNSESYLISKSLKLLPTNYSIVVSFAEVGAGHVGVVYQATNWIYTGLSAKRALWSLDGDKSGHARHRFDEYGGEKKAKEVFGDRMQKYYRPRKHRYVMFRGTAHAKKVLFAELKYKVYDYPKLVEKDMGGNKIMVLKLINPCDSCQQEKELSYYPETDMYHCDDCAG